MSGRGLTLYLLMWFWSFQIRAVRAVCRHEAQAEYTNPATAWHRTHTQTLLQRLKVTVSMSQSVRRQEKNKWKTIKINNWHSQGKIRCNLRERLLFFVTNKALSSCLGGWSVFYSAWSNTDVPRSSRCSSKANELWLALSLAPFQQLNPISHCSLWEKVL